MISRESREYARALMNDLAGSPVEQTPDMKSFGPIKFCQCPEGSLAGSPAGGLGESPLGGLGGSPLGGPGYTLTLSQPGGSQVKLADPQAETSAGKNPTQLIESRFKRALGAATRSASEAKKQKSSTVRVMLRNLRN